MLQELQPVIRRLAGRYGHTPEARKHIAACLMQAAPDAIRAHEPSCGTPLYPFVHRQLSLLAARAASGVSSDSDLASAIEEMIGPRERAPDLAEVVQGLPEADRELFTRYYYHGCSVWMTAADMGIGTAEARERLVRILPALRSAISAYGR